MLNNVYLALPKGKSPSSLDNWVLVSLLPNGRYAAFNNLNTYPAKHFDRILQNSLDTVLRRALNCKG